MGKIRTVSYLYAEDIAPSGVLSKTVNNLLRDVLPDQAFKVWWFQLNIISEWAPGDAMVFEMAKNISPPTVPISGALITTHSHIWRVEENKERPENVHEWWYHQLMFNEPLDFDRDDSLNIYMRGTNHGTGTYLGEYNLTIGYEVG